LERIETIGKGTMKTEKELIRDADHKSRVKVRMITGSCFR
jgi:hypothetical protein